MCGFAGIHWINRLADMPQPRNFLEAMLATLENRGPDRTGRKIYTNTSQGHKGLEIIAPGEAVQPMTLELEEGHSVTLVFNGMIANFPEIRNWLIAKGSEIKQMSDTETLIHLYLKVGIAECAKMLTGMFAFTIYDSRNDTTYMARDAFGIKPLHYSITKEGNFVYGSEIQTILASDQVEPEIDIDGVREMSMYYEHQSETAWKGIKKLRRGHYGIFNKENGLKIFCYWELKAKKHTDSPEQTRKKLLELLQKSVGDLLYSDVEVAVLLSGLDSGMVTSSIYDILKKLLQLARFPKTFTVDFKDQGVFVADPKAGVTAPRDTMYANLVAEFLGVKNNEILLSAEAMANPNVRSACIKAYGHARPMSLRDWALYLLIEAIRDFMKNEGVNLKVLISGEGGDELLNGYPFGHDPQARKARKFPWQVPGFFPLQAKALFREDFLQLLNMDAHETMRYEEAREQTPRMEGGEPEEQYENRVIRFLMLWLLEMMLTRSDRISMSQGVELRVPFCDKELWEYVFNIPEEMLSEGGPKGILKATAREANMLPDEALDLEKSGFINSTQPKLLILLKEQAVKIIHSISTQHDIWRVFDRAKVLLAAERDLKTMNPIEVLGIDNFLSWYEFLEHFQPHLSF